MTERITPVNGLKWKWWSEFLDNGGRYAIFSEVPEETPMTIKPLKLKIFFLLLSVAFIVAPRVTAEMPGDSESALTEEEMNYESDEGAAAESEEEGETGKAAVWTVSDLMNGGFIAKESSGMLKGTIVASENEHLLLGEGDVVYVVPSGKGKFRIGERYTIYEPVKSIHHPRTHRLLGKLIRIKGVVEIIPNSMASKKDTYSARIIKSVQLIGLRDSLSSYQPIDPINVVLNETPFPKELTGMVVASLDTKDNNGEHDIVYLDKGSRDGVQPGNFFVVYKEGKKEAFYSPSGIQSLPRRIVANLEVLSVEKETSTAIVAKSTEPVVVGDWISSPPNSR